MHLVRRNSTKRPASTPGLNPLTRPAPADEGAGCGPPSPPRGRGRGILGIERFANVETRGKGCAFPLPRVLPQPRSCRVEGIALHAARTKRQGRKSAEKAEPFPGVSTFRSKLKIPRGGRLGMNFYPSPPWGRGWRATGVLISRGETGEGVNNRERGGNHEGRGSLSHHAFSCSERRANPESARTSPHANGHRTSGVHGHASQCEPIDGGLRTKD